jgi:hypothetical protein
VEASQGERELPPLGPLPGYAGYSSDERGRGSLPEAGEAGGGSEEDYFARCFSLNWRALARLPQTFIEHQCAEWFFERS